MEKNIEENEKKSDFLDKTISLFNSKFGSQKNNKNIIKKYLF